MKIAHSLGWTLLGLLCLGAVVAMEPPASAQSTPVRENSAGGRPVGDRPVGGTIYVLTMGEWREAFVLQATGRISQGLPSWSYTVRYLDDTTEADVSADRVRTIDQAQAEGLTTTVYDLSTAAGIDQILTAHNTLRQAVGVDDLRWSTELATSAQVWADTLIEQRLFGHSPASLRNDGYVGENLTGSRAFGSGTALRSPQRAIQGWSDEKQNYDYETNRCIAGELCGHYTQMVWADTTEVGCAVARTASQNREVWVCHYAPGGNVVGQWPY